MKVVTWVFIDCAIPCSKTFFSGSAVLEKNDEIIKETWYFKGLKGWDWGGGVGCQRLSLIYTDTFLSSIRISVDHPC